MRERLSYPAPPTPQADRLLRQAAVAFWQGLEGAIDIERVGGSDQQISAQTPTGEVRRTIASAAAARRVAGLGEQEAFTAAQRAATSRMELICRRAGDGRPLCPELGERQ